jgi:predicted acyltransferase
MNKRANALDALRGFAIITMILSGSIPFSGPAALPGWMYHAQLPPPDHIFNPNIPGITWVDLVFPFFLFSMGAAFPFALRKRIAEGTSSSKLFLQALLRGFLLVVFALFLQHSKPYALSSSPGTAEWLIGLLGFLILFLIFYRYPAGINPKIALAVKILTGMAAVFLFSSLDYTKGSGFLISRSDIIILVLANTAFFGSLIWLLTKNNLLLRLLPLAFLFAFRITHSINESWTAWVWNASPLPEIYRFYFLQYLFIVIPGTIAGDLFYKWMNSEDKISQEKSSFFLYLFLICISLIIFNLTGLYSRMLLLNLSVNIVLLSAGLLLLRNPLSGLSALYKKFFSWGAFWLLLGLSFESYEGGIKKDPSTLSYYLVTAGLAFMALTAFSIVTDYWKKENYVNLLTLNGKNPMIAYISGSNIVMPLLAISGLTGLLNSLLINPWLGFIKGLIFTLTAAFITALFTKNKIFWRT